MTDITLFSIDFKNLVKLFKKGKIPKVYSEMYSTAESIALHETEKFMNEIYLKNLENKINKTPKDTFDYFSRIQKFREERIEFHLSKMFKLLEMSLAEDTD